MGSRVARGAVVAGAAVTGAAASHQAQTASDRANARLHGTEEDTDHSLSALRDLMLSTNPAFDSGRLEEILDLGIEMAQDPRVQAAVHTRISGSRQVPARPLAEELKEEVEEQQDLNEMLIRQNDQLMTQIDKLKEELRIARGAPPLSTPPPSSLSTSGVHGSANARRARRANAGTSKWFEWDCLPIILAVAAIIITVIAKAR